MLGIGCDLADVERIEKAITRKGFKERVYTQEEIAYCTGSNGDKASQRRPGQARTESDRLLRIPHRKDGCEKDTPYIKPHRYHCNGSGSVGII